MHGVSLLARILQFIVWLVVFIWAWRLVMRWLVRRPERQQGEPGQALRSKPLHRDSVCGTWVSPEISFTLEQAGQIHHFCSAECREKFRAGRWAAGE